MECPIYDYINYIKIGLFEYPILMKCLMTEIENDFNYVIANANLNQIS